jgi:hypothetical protein
VEQRIIQRNDQRGFAPLTNEAQMYQRNMS